MRPRVRPAGGHEDGSHPVVWVLPGLVDMHPCGHGSQVESHTGTQHRLRLPGKASQFLSCESQLPAALGPHTGQDPTPRTQGPRTDQDSTSARGSEFPPDGASRGASEPSAIRQPRWRTPFSSCRRPHHAAAGSARSEAGVTEPQAHSSSCVPTVMAAQSVKSSVISRVHRHHPQGRAAGPSRRAAPGQWGRGPLQVKRQEGPCGEGTPTGSVLGQ